ncbi:MAG: transglycosylase SLT domain-containing protein [Deltaproteobacteria bacterium]|nr:transglycosylase SLT domain-containing protein [Deltaproteobacteria bacterium]
MKGLIRGAVVILSFIVMSRPVAGIAGLGHDEAIVAQLIPATSFGLPELAADEEAGDVADDDYEAADDVDVMDASAAPAYYAAHARAECAYDVDGGELYASGMIDAAYLQTIAYNGHSTGAPTACFNSPDSGDAYTVPIVVNRNVVSFLNYFQTRGRKYFTKWLERSPDYMVMLQDILREQAVPVDLSYIALIESGLNPKAKSRAKAVGMWQFIKGTAKKFGLRVDWWIDERMDPEKATYAAARYFKTLYGEFGSWYLAAAGYNAGEGRIRGAVRKHRTDDFWELASYKRPLKRETREYVPKYIAAMLIAKDPASFGFDEMDLSSGRVYDKAPVPAATDLRVIALAAGTTVEEIQRINPELLRWFTPPDYPGYEIKIPSGTREAFLENFSKVPLPERISFHMHKVKRADTISKIAKLYKTDTKAILYLNNMKGVRSLRVGSTIAVPVRSNVPAGGATRS